MSQTALPARHPLDELPPLVLPVEPSWWPPAPGWWILGLVIFVLLAALFYFLRIVRRRQALKKHTIKQLTQLYNEINQTSTSQHTQQNEKFIHQSALLLRQFCIQQYQSESYASSTGENWLQLLDATVGETILCNETGKILIERYQRELNPSNEQISLIYQNILKWLNKAPVKPSSTGLNQSGNISAGNSR